jgi:xanthine dehydrogenase accessory factor
MQALDVYRKILDLLTLRRRFATAVVLSTDGSTPQKTGARAVIEADGQIWGTLGGGLAEAETQQRAIEACQSGRAIVFEFELEGTNASEALPICGGTMRILIDPTSEKDQAAYASAAETLQARRRGVLLTHLRFSPDTVTQVRMVQEADLSSRVELLEPNALQESLDQEAPCLVEGDRPSPSGFSAAFLEPVSPKPRLLIVGGGHVGQATALQAGLVGFDVTVVDDRPEFASRALYGEGVETRCGSIAEEVAAFPLNQDTYVVIVTRGHQHDADALKACLGSPAAYVGMIGSRRKVALMRKTFVESGIATTQQLDCVFAPIGLDLGAVTVPEIATSITAQLIAVRRKGATPGSPGHMRI